MSGLPLLARSENTSPFFKRNIKWPVVLTSLNCNMTEYLKNASEVETYMKLCKQLLLLLFYQFREGEMADLMLFTLNKNG